MARAFTPAQLQLIQGGRIKARLLAQFALDSGNYYFCDDVWDMSDGLNTWIGASALASCTDITSAAGFAAESATIIIDGDRLSQSGFTDPAYLFREIMYEMVHQRRVYLYLGLALPDSKNFTLVVPIYTGVINNCKVVYPAVDILGSKGGGDPSTVQPSQGQLIITLDSIASRYSSSTFRTRSHNDQLNIDSSDMFMSYVSRVVGNEQILYWGKNPPKQIANQGYPYGGSLIGGQYNPYDPFGGQQGTTY